MFKQDLLAVPYAETKWASFFTDVTNRLQAFGFETYSLVPSTDSSAAQFRQDLAAALEPLLLDEEERQTVLREYFAHAIVIQKDGKLMACLTVDFKLSNEENQRLGVVARFFRVDESIRCKGVGRLLFDSLKCFVLGCLCFGVYDNDLYDDYRNIGSMIFLVCTCEVENKGFIAFARKCGFQICGADWGQGRTQLAFEQEFEVGFIDYTFTPAVQGRALDFDLECVEEMPSLVFSPFNSVETDD